jgi:hypothetical protein
MRARQASTIASSWPASTSPAIAMASSSALVQPTVASSSLNSSRVTGDRAARAAP